MAEATEAQDTETTETTDQEQEVTTEEESTEASAGDDTTEETEVPPEDQEFEVVRESKGSQPKPAKPSHINFGKRVNKLNAKAKSAEQEREKANVELGLANERIKLLEMQRDQSNEAKNEPIPPKIEDYPEGVHDPEYAKKYHEYQDVRVEQEVEKQVNKQVNEATKHTAQTNTQAALSQDFKKKLDKHYDRSDEMGIKDYLETEDKAIASLGTDVARVLINNFDDSHVLMYYLGKNPGEAQRIADLMQTNLVAGLAEIGALRSDLKVKPKTKITPNPDKPLPGGSPSGTNDTDAKAMQLLTRAEKSGSKADMDKYFDHQANRRQEQAAKARAG